MSFFNELKRRNVFRVAAAYMVVAWLLIQVAETIFPLFGFDDTPARIIVIVLTIGLIPAMIFAWAFELTPEGLKKESEIDRSSSITPQTGKKLDRMIMVVLALALGYFAFDKFVLDPQREADQLSSLVKQKTMEVAQARQEGRTEALVDTYGEKSIAVLPFVNMSDDASNEYFSDGITEEILNLMAGIRELRVISRTSAFAYKDKVVHIPDVAERLNVSHVLEGSVRKSGNKVRITAQLIAARSDTHLWSKTYDRSLEDIFTVQDEIATEVTNSLKLTLMGQPLTVDATNPLAHEYYLQGNYFYFKGNHEKSVEYFRLSIDQDRDYLPAWHMLGRSYNMLRGGLPNEELFKLMRAASNESVRIDAEDYRTHVLQGILAFFADNNSRLAAYHFGHAHDLRPNDIVTVFYEGWLRSLIGQNRQSLELRQLAVKLDPTVAIMFTNLAHDYESLGQYDEAEKADRKALELVPDYGLSLFRMARISILKGEPETALERVEAINLEEDKSELSAIAHYELGNLDESNRILKSMIANHADEWAYSIGRVFAWRNEPDDAFKWIQTAIDENQRLGGAMRNDVLTQNIHKDPRFQTILFGLGLADSQVADIEF